MSFKILPDTATADVAFEARGETLNKVFEDSSKATSSVMVDLKTVRPRIKKSFSKQHKTLEGLLYAVLDELVFLKDAQSLVFSSFLIRIKKGRLNWADVISKGEKINPKTMNLRNDIKAVTWHQFSLKKKKAGWVAKVILDV